MAKHDDLIRQVNDPAIRAQLKQSLGELRRRKKFGLVFEGHLPETTILPSAGVHVGTQVILRKTTVDRTRYKVEKVTKKIATISEGNTTLEVPIEDLLVIKPFGEPVYPVLQTTDIVKRNTDKPFHSVINGENFYALQLLLYSYEGEVDCIYIDPPYNTGARDWTYNNDYVDSQDAWRHSKWLSMMEKRLKLSRRLLKPDGVLVVTIDEHEVHHLGVLLEQIFPDARRQMVTIVNNGAGVTQGGFYRVEEYAFFCFMGNARPTPISDDLLSDEGKEAAPIWFSLIRYGGVDGAPSRRPGMVFPIAIDPKRNRIIAAGKTLRERADAGEITGNFDDWRPDPNERLNGMPVVWPYRGDGTLGRWQMNPPGLMALVSEGFVRVRAQKNGPGGNGWSISYVKSGNQAKARSGVIPVLGREPDDGALLLGNTERLVVPKTVWRRARHDAGKWGSRSIRELLGSVSFDYAKSPYAVLDTLQTAIGSNRDALILDFFAGSGTTLQSTAMLNAIDDGKRRCILVTNNQVDEAMAAKLHSQGLYVGDDEYESHGICRAVTAPRIKAAFTGLNAKGESIQGSYINERDIAEGFDENVVFFDLAYLDPDAIEVGSHFKEIAPLLWLAAGGYGDPNSLHLSESWLLPDNSPFAVLLDEDRVRPFIKAITGRPDITHVWVVTDSEAAFARIKARMPEQLRVGMLYRDYLRNFQINVENV
jgi:adenine-specific DNA-methyltransferase